MLLKSINGSAADAPTSFGLGDSTKFNFNTVNGKAFKVLSSTLYQNKRGSIVREISSNAYDAHIAAGKADVPFEIHLPDTYEPYFSVRDFGTGLDENDIRTVYTTLFLSTKDESNEAIGAFGLGSKSPFAYTDSFTVTSILDGERKVYVASLDGTGHPTISIMSSNATDEGNGIEVNIAVDSNDFHVFASEVRTQLNFFKVKPVIKNGRGFEFNEMPTFFKTFGKLSILQLVGPTYVIQGGVGYPLDLEQVKPKLSASEQEFAKSMVRRGCHLNFDIGEIEVTPSREGISYEYHTIKNIAQVFKDAYTLFTDSIKNDMAALSSDLERLQYIARGGDLVINILREEKLYPQFSYSHSDAQFTLKGFEKNVKSQIKKADGTIEELDTVVQEYFIRMFSMGNRRGVSSITLQRTSVIPVNISNIKFVYNDGPVAGIARIRNYINENANARIYMFESNQHSTTDDTAKSIAFIEKALDGITVEKLSSIARPERGVGSGSGERRSGYKIPKCWQVESFINKNNSKDYEAVFEKLQDLDAGYYVVLNDFKQVTFDYSLHSLYEYMFKNGMMKKDTYIIRQKDVDYVRKTAGWESLEFLLNEKVKQEKAKSHVLDDVSLAFKSALSEFSYRSNVIEVFDMLAVDDPIVNKYKRYAELSKAYSDGVKPSRNPFYEIAVVNKQYYNTTPEITRIKTLFVAKIEKIKLELEKKYRLLLAAMPSRHYSVTDDPDFMKHAQLYINAVNTKPVDSN